MTLKERVRKIITSHEGPNYARNLTDAFLDLLDERDKEFIREWEKSHDASMREILQSERKLFSSKIEELEAEVQELKNVRKITEEMKESFKNAVRNRRTVINIETATLSLQEDKIKIEKLQSELDQAKEEIERLQRVISQMYEESDDL